MCTTYTFEDNTTIEFMDGGYPGGNNRINKRVNKIYVRFKGQFVELVKFQFPNSTMTCPVNIEEAQLFETSAPHWMENALIIR